MTTADPCCPAGGRTESGPVMAGRLDGLWPVPAAEIRAELVSYLAAASEPSVLEMSTLCPAWTVRQVTMQLPCELRALTVCNETHVPWASPPDRVPGGLIPAVGKLGQMFPIIRRLYGRLLYADISGARSWGRGSSSRRGTGAADSGDGRRRVR